MGVFEDPSEIQVNVEYGNAAILQMPFIESHPPPNVEWFIDDSPIPYQINYATVYDKLIILNTSEDNERRYRYFFVFVLPYMTWNQFQHPNTRLESSRAKAINTQLGKEENSPFFRLEVTGDPSAEVAPSIVIAPENTKVVREQETFLYCVANSR